MGRCLSKLVGVSVSLLSLLFLYFSCYDASSVNGLCLVTCSLGRQTKNSYLGCQTGLSDCGIRLEMLVWVSGVRLDMSDWVWDLCVRLDTRLDMSDWLSDWGCLVRVSGWLGVRLMCQTRC